MSVKFKSMRIALTLTFLLIVGSLSAQNVTGTVKDATGEAVIGATVQEQGTQNATVTDFDGNFTLKVSGNKPIVISYIGMKPQTIDVKGKSRVDVTLQDDNTQLEELVVIGYGSVKKKDITGSVATVGADAIAAVPVANASEALTGKMAGVQVTTTEGSPDADVSIRVRGGGSITQSNEPLYIVDGFPVESISDIAPSDIEDITVLKDASSTAIYGSRGANGVIMVTTKGGKEGKTNVSYNVYYSWKKIAKKYDVLSARDYASWQYELWQLRGKPEKYNEYFGNFEDLDMYNNVPTNDWQDQAYGRIGHTFNHNLSITGGAEKLKYAFSYAHIDDKAIMQGSSFKRDNISFKLNHKPHKKVSIDLTARFSRTKINGGGANEQSSSYNTDKRLRYAVQYTPIPVAGLTGDDEDLSAGNSFISPLTSIRDNDKKQERMQLNLGGAFTWEVYKNLKFKTEIGYDYYRGDNKLYYGLSTYKIQNEPKGDDQNKPGITLTKQYRSKLRNTNTLTYDFKEIFGKDSKHHLDALFGEEYVIQKNEVLRNTVYGFPTNFSAEDCWNLTTQGTPFEITDYFYPNDVLLSWFGRLNYNFDSKYLLSFTFRADGSSKFADGKRWGYFPSAALAWRISSEKFMEKTQSWLDDLKLRFSFGTAGNNNIPAGMASLTPEFQSIATSWINGYSSVWIPVRDDSSNSTMSNKNLKWETTITRNIGLDYVMFGGKLNGSFEFYWNNTKDLLIAFPVAGTGYTTQYRNMGETKNTGFEASVTWNAVNKKDWGLSIGANVSFNKNKVVSLGDLDEIDNIATGWASTEIDKDFMIKVGEPIGQIYGYVADGRYEVSDFDIEASQAQNKWVLKEGVADASDVLGTTVMPGMMKIKETKDEKTGKITVADRQVIGDTNPKCIGGFNINARAYGFDLAANFNWSIGNDVYNANKLQFTQTGKSTTYWNLIDEMAAGKRWTYINADGELLDYNNAEELAALNANTSMWTPYTTKYVLTSYGVEKASFFRLGTLTLGYTLPKSLLKKMYINSLRIYATCYNVFCITNYSGSDPEVSSIRKTNLTPGVDYSAYPKSRQFVIGMNVNF